MGFTSAFLTVTLVLTLLQTGAIFNVRNAELL